MKSLLHQFRLGRFVYQIWYRPRQWCDWGHAYGWRLAWRAATGGHTMAAAVRRLPELPPVTAHLDVPVYFLTGRRFWHQTAFCVHSFIRHSRAGFPLIFMSDGTLDANIAERLTALFPNARVLSHVELSEKIAAFLPRSRYPALNTHRHRFVLLRKLTDTLVGEHGYRLFFDSDMLFWNHPGELLARVRRGESLYMADAGGDGYTLPRSILKQYLSVEPAPTVNSGLIGVHADNIDWDLLERACALLLTEGQDQRLLEQTLWAILLAQQNARALPASDYRVVIDPPACRAALAEGRPVLMHYAWHACLSYAADEWQRYLQETATR
jgi:hypothetical protein